MYKVMLADDEKLILDGLKNIIDWNEMGLEIVQTARNGEEALALFAENPVDIVVTDINMPKVNGLELLRKLREINEDVRFVILSGYDEFEYAKKAIQIGVEGYLLKPIDEEEFKKILLKLVREFDKQDRENERVKNILKSEDRNAHKVLKDKEQYSLCIYKLLMQEGQSITKAKEYINKIEQEALSFYIESDELILINGWDKFMQKQSIKAYYEQIVEQLSEVLDIESFGAMGTVVTEIEALKESFEISKSLLSYLLVQGFGIVATPDLLEKKRGVEGEVDIAKLRRMIIEQNQKDVITYIQDILISNVRNGELVPEDLYHMCIQIAILLDEIVRDFSLKKNRYVYNLKGLIEQIYKVNNLAMLTTLLIERIREVMDAINENRVSYTPVVQQVVTYVHENYKEDMSLKVLAHKYNINTSYLGQVFLKEVGCSFSQYLNQVKNSKAKELILTTNMKVNDIAKEVGYVDTSYFYRKFKKYYGVSPASFREMKVY